jgi:ABC-2 type transport system permease protein
MKNLYWLIRREIWEHKVEFVWAPVLVSALFVVLAVAWSVNLHSGFHAEFLINGEPFNPNATSNVGHGQLFQQAIGAVFATMAYIQFSLVAFVVFTYFAGTLVDEKRDRSVLFWKSMPVTDTEVILSKVITGAGLVPIFSVLVALASVLLVGLVVAFGMSRVAGSGSVFTSVFDAFNTWAVVTLSTLPLQIVWAIPTIGWALMVSSFVRTNATLWAIGTPLIALAIVAIFTVVFRIEWQTAFGTPFLRLVVGTIPTSWLTIYDSGDGGDLAASFIGRDNVTRMTGLWLGVLAGAAMTYVAVLMRRRASGD